jgi:hypothetical protein
MRVDCGLRDEQPRFVILAAKPAFAELRAKRLHFRDGVVARFIRQRRVEHYRDAHGFEGVVSVVRRISMSDDVGALNVRERLQDLAEAVDHVLVKDARRSIHFEVWRVARCGPSMD